MSVDVHDDDDLDEGDEGEAGGAVGVDEGQPIFSGLCCEQNSHKEAKQATATWKFCNWLTTNDTNMNLMYFLSQSKAFIEIIQQPKFII